VFFLLHIATTSTDYRRISIIITDLPLLSLLQAGILAPKERAKPPCPNDSLTQYNKITINKYSIPWFGDT
jgi:hypothetical protein